MKLYKKCFVFSNVHCDIEISYNSWMNFNYKISYQDNVIEKQYVGKKQGLVKIIIEQIYSVIKQELMTKNDYDKNKIEDKEFAKVIDFVLSIQEEYPHNCIHCQYFEEHQNEFSEEIRTCEKFNQKLDENLISQIDACDDFEEYNI